MSLREIAKAHLSDDQRKGLRRIYTAFASHPWTVRLSRAIRRAGIERRLGALPGGRGWRSTVPQNLHYSLLCDTLMRAGEYIVVEDAIVTQMGEDARFDGGPARAIGSSCASAKTITSSTRPIAIIMGPT